MNRKEPRKTKLLSSIEDTRPGWTRRTQKRLKEVSMSRLPFDFSCMARWSIYCCHSSCLYIERVCAVTIRALQWHWQSVIAPPSLTWVKSTIAMTKKSPPAFQGIILQFALQPEFTGTNPACNKPILSRSGSKKRVLSLIVSQIRQTLELRLICIRLAFLIICWIL